MVRLCSSPKGTIQEALMPQIFIMFSPVAQRHLARSIGQTASTIKSVVTPIIMTEWGVPEDDIACSAMNLIFVDGEADIQIEIGYTVIDHEYVKGQPFEPLPEAQMRVVNRALNTLKDLVRPSELSLSCWTRPGRGLFKM
jgi:hypothetical protein